MPLSAAEQAELNQLQAELAPKAAAGSGGGLTPAEQAELAQLKQELGGEPAAAPEPSLGHKVMDGIGRVVDYTSGIGRTAVAASPQSQLLQLLSGVDDKKKIGTWDDIKNALKGKAPHSADYMERLGVPEGGQLSNVLPVFAEKGQAMPWQLEKGGMFDVTPRGVAGGVLDIATDPSTYLTMGASAAERVAAKEGATAAEKAFAKNLATAAKVANPTQALMEVGGRKLYNSGFKKVDEVAKDYGKTVMPSDVYWNNGVWGTANSVADQSKELADRLLAKRNGVLVAADAAGARVDVNAALADAKAQIAEMKLSKDPAKMSAARAMERKLPEYEALAAKPAVPDQVISEKIARPGEVDLITGAPVMETHTRTIPGSPEVVAPNASQASGIKSSIYDMVGGPSYKEAAQTPAGKEILKAHGQGWKTATEQAVEDTLGAKSGQTVRDVNENLGAVLTGRKALDKEAAKETTRNGLTPLDALLLSLGHGAGVAPVALKKSATLFNSMIGSTGGGRLLYKAGQSEPVWAHMLQNSSRVDDGQ